MIFCDSADIQQKQKQNNNLLNAHRNNDQLNYLFSAFALNYDWKTVSMQFYNVWSVKICQLNEIKISISKIAHIKGHY